MKNRVVIIGDITSGFRIHGMFSNNADAFEYTKRHADRFRGEGWAGNSQAIMIVNLDTMTEDEISEYEDEVGHGWDSFADA